MSEKKRKRDTHDGQSSTKRKKSEVADQIVKVVPIKDFGEWVPAVATAPGLDLPTDVPLQVFTKARKNLTSQIAGRSSLADSEILLYSSAHPTLDYTACEETSSGADSLLQHYVGVYDPKMAELRVVPARKLVVRGTLRSSASQATGDGSLDDRDALKPKPNARVALGEAFGTKKSQKAIRSKTDNAIVLPLKISQTNGRLVLDPAASAVMESMPQVSTMKTREELQELVDEGKPRPKANLDAETPAEVYPVENLVGVDTLKLLNVRAWQEAVQSNEDVETKSRFVSNRLRKVVQLGDVKRLKALRFMLLLIDWYSCLKTSGKGSKKLPPKEDFKSAVGSDIGESVLDGVRRRFAPDLTLNKWAIDHLMTHICALALTIDNYEVDVVDLREDLRLEPKQAPQYFREIGCQVTSPTESERTKMRLTKAESASHKIARLKLPLDFPKVRVIPTMRRK